MLKVMEATFIDVLHMDFEILDATHARVYGLRAYTLHAEAHTRRTAKLPK